VFDGDSFLTRNSESPAGDAMTPEIIVGNLLDQDVDVLVNAWNRNIIPWWLLLPQGVSGAIKRRAGLDPFRQVAGHGPIPLGGAVLTGAGRLPHKGIIHVAGINAFWFATERSIRGSVRSAMGIAEERGFQSIAFPVIGAGSGSYNVDKALALMLDEFTGIESLALVRIVLYRKGQ
jgi:O-acetyl-ADP-ribose deacetylase (regulator of RNase III)